MTPSRPFKDQEFVDRHIQLPGDIKQCIQRNGFADIGGFYVTEIGGGAPNAVSQFLLCDSPELAEISDA